MKKTLLILLALLVAMTFVACNMGKKPVTIETTLAAAKYDGGKVLEAKDGKIEVMIKKDAVLKDELAKVKVFADKTKTADADATAGTFAYKTAQGTPASTEIKAADKVTAAVSVVFTAAT